MNYKKGDLVRHKPSGCVGVFQSSIHDKRLNMLDVPTIHGRRFVVAWDMFECEPVATDDQLTEEELEALCDPDIMGFSDFEYEPCDRCGSSCHGAFPPCNENTFHWKWSPKEDDR